MIDERFTSALIGGAVTSIVTIVTYLINRGRREEQFDRMREQLNALSNVLNEKVSFALFKEEITELHGRISRTQREQAAAMEKLETKVDRLADGLSFLSGALSGLPAKIDAITERLNNAKRD